MRIALLSTLAKVADGTPRALISLGGRPLIAWQIDLAKELDCEKLLCLMEGGDETAAAVEKEAALAGIEVELLGGPRHLLGKITADQDLVVIADGLLMDAELAREHFAERRGVAAISDHPGIEKGFERIDPDRAWAGLLIVRGSVGEQLAEMPADADTVSLLLRMALQSGTRVMLLDELHLGMGEILLARSVEDLAQREKTLLDNSARNTSWAGPGERLASNFARWLAPAQMARGPAIALGLGGILLAAAIALSWYEFLVVSLAALSLGSFSISLSQALRHLRARLHRRITNRRFSMALNASVDGAVIAVLSIANLPAPLIEAIFVPALLVGLWRLAAPLSPPQLGSFWRDRTSLSMVLLVLAAFTVVQPAMPIMVLILLCFALISEASARLTQA